MRSQDEDALSWGKMGSHGLRPKAGEDLRRPHGDKEASKIKTPGHGEDPRQQRSWTSYAKSVGWRGGHQQKQPRTEDTLSTGNDSLSGYRDTIAAVSSERVTEVREP